MTLYKPQIINYNTVIPKYQHNFCEFDYFLGLLKRGGAILRKNHHLIYFLCCVIIFLVDLRFRIYNAQHKIRIVSGIIFEKREVIYNAAFACRGRTRAFKRTRYHP